MTGFDRCRENPYYAQRALLALARRDPELDFEEDVEVGAMVLADAWHSLRALAGKT